MVVRWGLKWRGEKGGREGRGVSWGSEIEKDKMGGEGEGVMR